MPQVIYESDPMATRGKAGPMAQRSFAVGQAMLDKHPELSCVILTLVAEDPETPSQNCVCFRKDIMSAADAEASNKRAHSAIVEAMRAMLKLAKQIEAHGLFGPRSQQG
jgi:hypothetical protein